MNVYKNAKEKLTLGFQVTKIKTDAAELVFQTAAAIMDDIHG